MYSELGEKFKEKLLNIGLRFVNSATEIPDYSYTALDSLEIPLPKGGSLVQDYATSSTYSILVGMNTNNLEDWKRAYATDNLCSKVLQASLTDHDEAGHYTQYQIQD